MSNHSIDEKNILSVDRIEMSDTISQFMEKVNNNFSKIVQSGGGPDGPKGDVGNQGVPTKPKVPIHVWKEGEQFKTEEQIGQDDYIITNWYENLTDVKYQEGHIIMLQNGHVYILESDADFILNPKYLLTLQTYMPGEVVDGKKAYVHIAYADDAKGNGFVTADELSNGSNNTEPVATYSLRRNTSSYTETTSTGVDKAYMGIYTNHTQKQDTDPNRYIWVKIQGGVGLKGDKGDKGDSGEKGEAGDRGPAGEPGQVGGRGATGIPGVSYINLYCLGTEDIYFGSDDFNDKKEEDLLNSGWFAPEDIPSSQIYSFDLNTTEGTNDYNNFITKSSNLGSIIKKKGYGEEEYIYYILNNLENPTKLSDINENIVIKDDLLYLWCIQGNEKFSLTEGTDEKTDYYSSTISWGRPFRLQGMNGLKGTDGSRGQVVYPMGSYNPNEVYITTEQKAPYVYDPSDGEFYVLNVVNKPWVGILPEGFENIYTHPSDATKNNTKEVTSIPTSKVEDNIKYLLCKELYYIWDNNSNSYIKASKKKYEYNGDWITDQDGVTPSTNYSDLTLQDNEPAWVKFESFQALYTSIGIIANGLIGSAVYNNEFMFSQYGCDSKGSESNFAFETATDKGGFLSAYHYNEKGEVDENGNKTGRHWMYNDEYINDTQVDPYQTNDGKGKNDDNEYIHGFIPNFCINFKTGQMWASRGKVYNGPADTNLVSLGELADQTKNYVNVAMNNYETDGINLISARPEAWNQTGPTYAPLPISDKSKITHFDIFSETDYGISLNELIEVNFNNIYVKIHNENFYAIIIQYDNNYNVINIQECINSAINLLENTKYISVTIKYIIDGVNEDGEYVDKPISTNEIRDVRIKIEKGDKPTPYTLAPEDVNSELIDVNVAFNETNELLSKSLEDGYLSKDEQVRIKDKLDTLEVQFNELKSEHTDLINNEYLKGNTEDKTTPKGKLQGIFNSLSESHDKFKIEIEKLLNVNFEDDNTTYKVRTLNNDNTSLRKYKVNLDVYFSSGVFEEDGLGWEYKYADGDWNWGDDISKDKKPGFKDYQIKYENDLQSYTEEVLIAQNIIQEEIKNSIQVGGVNLIEFNKLENNGYLNFTKQRPKITVEYNKNDTQPAIQLPDYSVIEKGYEYVLSYNFKKISGTISKIGMPLTTTGCENVQIYIDNTFYSLNTGSDVGFTVNYTADTNEHKVIIKFKTTSEVKEQNIIQFNRKLTTAFKVEVSNIQLEVGNVATEYKPNDADIIEARENILKGGMMVSLIGVGDGVPKDLTTTLKANTEYVFSVENSTNNSSIHLVNATQSASLCNLNVSKNKKNYITFTTPNYTNSKVYLFADDNSTTLYGIKLAEGNKYTPWEGTADEQKTLIMLNNAMNGTTETNGGLMLTNTIGMKGSTDENNTITAGINGLNSTVSGMESDLRFWAGSNTWEDIQSAPFRVYDNGKVYGTHFYGFHSALPILTFEDLIKYSKPIDTFSNVYIIDIKKTGSKILLGDITTPTTNARIVGGGTTSTFAISLPTPDYYNENGISFEEKLEYVGSEIEIYNPFKKKLHICGCDMPHPEYCNIYNMMENITTPSGCHGYPYDNPYRWTINKDTCDFNDGVSYTYAKYKCIKHQINYQEYISDYITFYKSSDDDYYVILWVLVECIK